jgi:hypothetical protein
MKLITAAALLLASQQAAAAPPTRAPCVTRAEIADMAVYFLPLVLDIVTVTCRPALPANAFLLNEGAALTERLSAGREGRWPGAREAFVKIIGGMPKGVTAETIRQVVDDMFREKLPAEIKTADCGTVDDLTRLLSPLPADNLGELSGLLVALSTKDKKGKGPPVCAPTAS